MSQAVYAKVIKRLTNTYGPPNAPDPDALFDEFCKALKGYSEHLLEKAMDRVISERTFPGWPVVGEVVDAVKVQARLNVGPPPEHMKFSLEPEPDKKYVDPKRVQDIVASVGNTFYGRNDYEAIVERTPIGGTCDVSAPWGYEVTDKNGRVVPIRKRRGEAA